MPDALTPTQPRDSWLPWIQFPGMNIEDVRLSQAENLLDTQLEKRVGKQTEVASARPRQRLAADPETRQRRFRQPAVLEPQPLTPLQRCRLTVSISGDGRGEEGRVVLETLLFQERNRPIGQRETRRSVTADSFTRDLLEHVFRTPDIGGKLPLRQLVDQLMVIAVRRDLVPGGRESPHEPRRSLCEPPENEASRLDVVLSH